MEKFDIKNNNKISLKQNVSVTLQNNIHTNKQLTTGITIKTPC